MFAVNRFQTYGLVGLAGVAVLATVDSALGLGGGAFLADICRTFLEDDPAGMGDMRMEVKPVPLIALSLVATVVAITALTREHQRAAAGRSAPDDEERAAVLSAMLIVATSQGRTSREEIMDVFRIVTHHQLDDDLLNLSYDRYLAMSKAGSGDYRLPPVSTSIGRRRTLAAALMIGCVARPATEETLVLIESLALDIGATSEDISAARQALEAWQDGCSPVAGVSPITVLRHRALQLAPV